MAIDCLDIYKSFKPNKVTFENNAIYIDQLEGKYTFIALSLIQAFGIFALAYVVYDHYPPVYLNNLIGVVVVGLWVAYPFVVMFKNVFFTYRTTVYLNKNSIAFSSIFRKARILYIDDFNNITFTANLYYDGLRCFDYRVLLNYKNKKYVIMSSIPYKRCAQYAISVLEAAVKRELEEDSFKAKNDKANETI